MGWEDNCEHCGGHTNKGGVTLHKPSCLLVPKDGDTFETTILKVPDAVEVDPFTAGVLRNLVFMEARTRHFFTNELKKLTHQDVLECLGNVLARFPSPTSVDKSVELFIVKGVLEELDGI